MNYFIIGQFVRNKMAPKMVAKIVYLIVYLNESYPKTLLLFMNCAQGHKNGKLKLYSIEHNITTYQFDVSLNDK